MNERLVWNECSRHVFCINIIYLEDKLWNGNCSHISKFNRIFLNWLKPKTKKNKATNKQTNVARIRINDICSNRIIDIHLPIAQDTKKSAQHHLSIPLKADRSRHNLIMRNKNCDIHFGSLSLIWFSIFSCTHQCAGYFTQFWKPIFRPIAINIRHVSTPRLYSLECSQKQSMFSFATQILLICGEAYLLN